ncbi:SulP family inorganic anion transporter [Treponema brennaborense]|uniref:Sulphate transporter n=1 Tax=Treponema brennaborense (strain DSM 12168 / CIP 105900 / DD5/3) TaxID=906968 RepID=F4LJP6_TREBD|nr:SulP family inorganic anion transporter [Treponema brennaborense]AEE17426.1 sulphate transporter [Treponema brennaborense DSM 12168]
MFKPELLNSLKGYSVKTFASDLSAGIIVGIVALPLAIAFAIASGVAPERGLYTAIVAGFIISVLGGSKVQIGGPTGAFVVIVYGIVRQYGFSGLMLATMMAGVMLILLGAFKMGILVKYIPYTIITGFTAGIAVTILTTQIGDFFGLTTGPLPGDFLGKIKAYAASFGTVNPYAVAVGAVSLAVILVWPKINKKIPGSLVVIILITAAVKLLNLPVDTIGSRYGAIPASLPAPQLPAFSFELLRKLFAPALSIAILAAIESLLSAVVADGMIGSKHDSNTELIAQGIANIASPLFGGIPATGAIARTATNIKNGGRTPVAGIVHAITLLLIMFIFGRFAVYIPLAALAAVLVSVAWNMAGIPAIKALFKGQKSDITVLAVTFLLTVFIDLTVAIEVGLICAAFFFIKKMIDLSSIRQVSTNKPAVSIKPASAQPSQTGRSETDVTESTPALPDGTFIFEIEGPLFFGTIQKFEEATAVSGITYKALVLRMQNTMYLDAGGIHVLEQLYQNCCSRNVILLISEIHTQPYMLAIKTGLTVKLGNGNFFSTFEEALTRAAEICGK